MNRNGHLRCSRLEAVGADLTKLFQEAEYDARLGAKNLMASEEVNCLFLDDTNVT